MRIADIKSKFYRNQILDPYVLNFTVYTNHLLDFKTFW